MKTGNCLFGYRQRSEAVENLEMLCNVAAGGPSNTQLWEEMENLRENSRGKLAIYGLCLHIKHK